MLGSPLATMAGMKGMKAYLAPATQVAAKAMQVLKTLKKLMQKKDEQYDQQDEDKEKQSRGQSWGIPGSHADRAGHDAVEGLEDNQEVEKKGAQRGTSMKSTKDQQ